MFGFSAQSAHSEAPNTPSPSMRGDQTVGAEARFSDGTPMRVASIVLLSIIGLAGLKWAGF